MTVSGESFSKLLLVCLILAASFMAAGCLGSDDSASPQKDVWSTVSKTLSETGTCTNPETEAATSTVTIAPKFELSDGYLCGVVCTLSWTDDHQGTDSSDTYDKFTVTIDANKTKATKDSSTGKLEVSLGYVKGASSASSNSTNSTNSTSSAKDTSGDESPANLGTNATITVSISDCGTYGTFRPNGLLRYYDNGNDFKLDITYILVVSSTSKSA